METPELLIVGAGLAGLAAAIAAVRQGVAVRIVDQGTAADPGPPYGLLVGRGVAAIWEAQPPQLDWLCGRFAGVAGEPYVPAQAWLIDRHRLHAAWLAAVQRAGVPVVLGAPARWEDGWICVGMVRSAAGRVVFADGSLGTAGPPEAAPESTAWQETWIGEGQLPSSFLLRASLRADDGNVVLAQLAPGRWLGLGWRHDDGDTPPGAPGPGVRVHRRPVRSPGIPGPAICGDGWLRIGGAAHCHPAHGFGMAMHLSLALEAGSWAAALIREGAPEIAWRGWADRVAPTLERARGAPQRL